MVSCRFFLKPINWQASHLLVCGSMLGVNLIRSSSASTHWACAQVRSSLTSKKLKSSSPSTKCRQRAPRKERKQRWQRIHLLALIWRNCTWGQGWSAGTCCRFWNINGFTDQGQHVLDFGIMTHVKWPGQLWIFALMASFPPWLFSLKKLPFKTSSVFGSPRTLCFEDYGDSEESDSSSLAAQMCRRLCQKFGLESDGPMAQTVLQRSCNLVWGYVGDMLGDMLTYCWHVLIFSATCI